MSDTTITISKKTLSFLLQLAKELKTQDSRATANPRYYTITETEETAGYEVDSTSEGNKWISPHSYSDNLYTDEMACKKAGILKTSPFWESKLEDEGWKLSGIRLLTKHSNAFLSEKAALNHINVNRHNLSNPSTFLMYANRNPELLGIINAILEISEKNE